MALQNNFATEVGANKDAFAPLACGKGWWYGKRWRDKNKSEEKRCLHILSSSYEKRFSNFSSAILAS